MMDAVLLSELHLSLALSTSIFLSVSCMFGLFLLLEVLCQCVVDCSQC